VQDQIWTFYNDLKAFKESPDEEQKNALSKRFDGIFTQKTCFQTLNMGRKVKRPGQSIARIVGISGHFPTNSPPFDGTSRHNRGPNTVVVARKGDHNGVRASVVSIK